LLVVAPLTIGWKEENRELIRNLEQTSPHLVIDALRTCMLCSPAHLTVILQTGFVGAEEWSIESTAVIAHLIIQHVWLDLDALKVSLVLHEGVLLSNGSKVALLAGEEDSTSSLKCRQ